MAYTLDTVLNYTLKRTTTIVGAETLSALAESKDELSTQFLEIASATGVDNAINLGGITTVDSMLMISDQTVRVKLNGEPTGVDSKLVFLKDCSITGVALANTSGSTANIRFLASGT